MFLFGGPYAPPPVEAHFVSRPNRFLITAEVRGETVRAHCPNPGRLWEIFHPGRRLLLIPSNAPDRSTRWSLAAAFYKDQVIPMNAAGSNRIARELLFKVLFPQAEEIRGEFTLPPDRKTLPTQKMEKSRFDFYFEQNGQKCLLEIKSCTLTEEGVAMFPDAPTLRGRRHVEELADLQKSGKYESHVLFVLHHRDTRSFVPNFYTDPDFSITLRDRAPDLHLHAVSVSTDATGRVVLVDPDLPVDFAPVSAAEADRGFFLLVIQLKEFTSRIPPGWYVTVLNAPRDLLKTMNRHLRKNKVPVHPLDHLTGRAGVLKGIPVYTKKNLADEFSRELKNLKGRPTGPQSEMSVFFEKNDKTVCEDKTVCDDSTVSYNSFVLYPFSGSPIFDEHFTRLLFKYRHGKALIS